MHTSIVRTFATVVLALGLVVSGCGGARTFTARGTQRDPGADARIQVENLDGGNHLMTMTATNITPPDRIGDGNTVFLVWIRLPNGQTTMESQLAYTADERTGRATITTPQEHFTLLVTAEADANATAPSDRTVFQQEISL
jgi:hypothetical protein